MNKPLVFVDFNSLVLKFHSEKTVEAYDWRVICELFELDSRTEQSWSINSKAIDLLKGSLFKMTERGVTATTELNRSLIAYLKGRMPTQSSSYLNEYAKRVISFFSTQLSLARYEDHWEQQKGVELGAVLTYLQLTTTPTMDKFKRCCILLVDYEVKGSAVNVTAINLKKSHDPFIPTAATAISDHVAAIEAYIHGPNFIEVIAGTAPMGVLSELEIDAVDKVLYPLVSYFWAMCCAYSKRLTEADEQVLNIVRELVDEIKASSRPLSKEMLLKIVYFAESCSEAPHLTSGNKQMSIPLKDKMQSLKDIALSSDQNANKKNERIPLLGAARTKL